MRPFLRKRLRPLFRWFCVASAALYRCETPAEGGLSADFYLCRRLALALLPRQPAHTALLTMSARSSSAALRVVRLQPTPALRICGPQPVVPSGATPHTDANYAACPLYHPVRQFVPEK